jgi:hypothetical protein
LTVNRYVYVEQLGLCDNWESADDNQKA